MEAADRALDRLVGPVANPLRQLGALGFWLFWIVVASGSYVYIFFDTSVAGAYASVEALSRSPWHGLLRSIHRYASDGLMLIIGLHLVREMAYRRYRGFRWFAWASGVPLIQLALASGLIGYWLVWDELAQFIAFATMEWLGELPGLGGSLVRNFIESASVSDRFFSLMMFAHIGVSLLMLLGMWIHIQRIAAPRTWPVAGAGWAALVALLALCALHPAASQAAADLARVPMAPGLDWWFVFPLAAVYAASPAGLWFTGTGVTLLLLGLPWLDTDPADDSGDAPAAAIRERT